MLYENVEYTNKTPSDEQISEMLGGWKEVVK